MFSFTGLTAPQVDALAQKAHIYMTRDGEYLAVGKDHQGTDDFSGL
jgi:aspartate aminotransferase